MRILVTGGCGYVGCRLSEFLADRGHDVLALDTMWYGQGIKQGTNLGVYRGDANHFITEEWWDAVIHLAAVSNDPSVAAWPRETWDSNVLSIQRMFQNLNFDRFILASSGSVYGLSDAHIVGEEHPLVPMSDYNKSKMIAERVAISYKTDSRITILRPGTVCGMSSRLRLDVAGNALAVSAVCGEIEIHGGDQMRPIIAMEDMLRVYEWALHRHSMVPEIFNVATDVMSIADLGYMAQKLNPDADLVVRDIIDPRSYRLSTLKIQSEGFEFKGNILAEMSDVYTAVADGTIDNPLDSKYHNAKHMVEIFG